MRILFKGFRVPVGKRRIENDEETSTFLQTECITVDLGNANIAELIK